MPGTVDHLDITACCQLPKKVNEKWILIVELFFKKNAECHLALQVTFWIISSLFKALRLYFLAYLIKKYK